MIPAARDPRTYVSPKTGPGLRTPLFFFKSAGAFELWRISDMIHKSKVLSFVPFSGTRRPPEFDLLGFSDWGRDTGT